jgi:hypothetical protein
MYNFKAARLAPGFVFYLCSDLLPVQIPNGIVNSDKLLNP